VAGIPTLSTPSAVRFNCIRRNNSAEPYFAGGSILFLRFELPDEHREMRGHGRGEGVVLILEALPNC
jgi:hypothetical protein